MIEVPEFIRGEAGFTIKLNQLAEAVRELQVNEKPVAKRPSAKVKPETTDAVGGLSE